MKLNASKNLSVFVYSAFLLFSACGGGNGYGGGANTGGTLPYSQNFKANLNGTQETPPNPSLATGNGTVMLNLNTSLMEATVTTSGIVANAAHIHIGVPGVAGAVVFPLTETVAGSGIWKTTVTLSATQLAALQAGNYYFNVHSIGYPGGEIRGQILAS